MKTLLSASLFLVLVACGSAEVLRCAGIVGLPKGEIAYLVAPDGRFKWCAVGESFEELKVTEIRSVSEEVVLVDASGKPVTLKLQKAAIKKVASDSAAALIPLQDLNWKWIKSPANPMQTQPESLPEWAYFNWEQLEESVKIDLKNYYRVHGWDTQVLTSRSGRPYVQNLRLKDPAAPVPTIEELRKTARPAGKL